MFFYIWYVRLHIGASVGHIMYHDGDLCDSSSVVSRALKHVNMSTFVPDRTNPTYWYCSNHSMIYTVYMFEIM